VTNPPDGPASQPLSGLVFAARVGDATLRGVEPIELDDRDRISSCTVAARPRAALRVAQRQR